MKYRIFIITFLFFTVLDAQLNNLAPSTSATDQYFGVKITDEYRNLENLKDTHTIVWMKSQTDYANTVINTIPNRNYYLNKRLELDKRQGYSISSLKITSDDKYFYLKKKSNEKVAKVYYRKGFTGKEEVLYDPSHFISINQTNTSHDFIINLISPSWDGNRLAISLSEKGKEFSEVIIMDVKTKHIHPEIITNINPSSVGGIKWLGDNSGFFYVYYPTTDKTSDTFGKNTQSILYKIGEDPKKLNVVFSNHNNPDLKIGDMGFPAVLTFNPNNQNLIGIIVDSEDFRDTFIISKKDLLNGKKNWKPLYTKKDKIFNINLIGEDLYFMSGENSSNFKLCRTNVNNPDFRNPIILIPEKKDEVLTNYTITSDGIYYTTTKNGVEAKLYSYKNEKENLIKLPYTSGNISLQTRGKDFSDLWVSCSGWANEEQRFKYNLNKNTFTLENLVPVIEYPEFKDIIVDEITVKSYDGTEVPLSLIYKKDIKRDGKAPVLMQAYGAYAESYYPFFARSYLVWANQGGIIAVPHIRGGGEKGEQWHIDGQKLKKPNSWKDLIACAEYLIDQNYTSPKKIAIWGASAGGITIGRALTEKPELFGAAIIEAGVLNPLRNEFGGTIKTSVQEYGSIEDANGFKGLLEMDAYMHVKKDVQYPATLITSGINDPRVAPWMPSKFAAKLLANNASKKPNLLKIDYNGGHGADVPVSQLYSNISDIFAFAFWQLGHPDYQPSEK